MMSDRPRIPGYELIEVLGGGPMTWVWSARQFAGDEAVAIKTLRPGWGYPEIALSLLRREAAAGLAVRHPHLVRVRSASVDRPPFFLAMDLLSGEPLRRKLQREYRIETGVALWISRQVAEALAALHRGGFVHGDVKPDNILLLETGAAVLIDLGFARRTSESAEFLDKGLILGTADYLAPELCVPDAVADGRADVFSLGVMLYEMLTGRLPFPTGAPAETLLAHRRSFPAELPQAAGRWPAGTPRLLRRLLARRPADRLSAGRAVAELMELEIEVLARRAA
jgi:serine/threonine protein kinase